MQFLNTFMPLSLISVTKWEYMAYGEYKTTVLILITGYHYVFTRFDGDWKNNNRE